MRQSIAVLFVLALLHAVGQSKAYPTLWATKSLFDDVLDGAPLTPENCITHPAKKEGGHGAPTADRAISITATDAGKAVKELCPGVPYTVTVKYPERRRTLLTTTAGSWDTGNATCPALIYSTKAQQAVETFNTTLTVPCNATAESSDLKVTSAAGPSAAFKTASLKLPIAALDKCPQSKCAAVNATAGNDTLAASGTLSDEATAAANATADNATALSGPNATAAKGPAAAAAAKAPEGNRTRSAAAASSPAGFVAAAAVAAALFAALL